MSGKVMGSWSRGRSTSRPYPRIWKRFDGDYWATFVFKPTLDVALTMCDDRREEFIEWLLDERRKELMMADWYQSEMQEAAEGLPFAFEHHWMSDGQRRFTRYVMERAEQLGVEV